MRPTGAQRFRKRRMEGVQGLSLTQNKGSNESSSHAAGTKQDSMVNAEVPIWDPPKYHCRDRGQEANHSSLNLKTKNRQSPRGLESKNEPWVREEGNSTHGAIPGGLASSKETPSLTYRADRYGKLTVEQKGAICLPVRHAILKSVAKSRHLNFLTLVLVGLAPTTNISTSPFTFSYLYQSHVPRYHPPELFGCIHLANISLQEDITTSLKTDSILLLLTVKFLPASYASSCQEQGGIMTSNLLRGQRFHRKGVCGRACRYVCTARAQLCSNTPVCDVQLCECHLGYRPWVTTVPLPSVTLVLCSRTLKLFPVSVPAPSPSQWQERADALRRGRS